MFFQVDDQFQVNPKARALAERLLDDDPWGLAAIGLWTMCGSLAQAALTDGVVTRTDLARLTLNPAAAVRIAGLLVEVGLWHAPEHDCDRCPDVADGTWVYHDWFDLKYDRGEQVKTTRRKRKELQDPNLIGQVWARDCIDPPTAVRGLCRYCGKELKRKDRRSDDAWQLDHVDPSRAIGPSNVVLACGPCNRTKGRRVPEVAGMTLRKPPRHSAEPTVDHRATPVDSEADRAARPAGRRSVDRAPHAADPAPASENVAVSGSSPGSDDGINLISGLISDRSELSSGARGDARAGQGRVGQGSSGVREGTAGQGSAGSGRGRRGGRRRKRRGRTQSDHAGTPPAPSPSPKPRFPGTAGECPPVEVAGQFGSPWHGFRGEPTTEETRCRAHGEPAPCRHCVRGES
ncbi:5-methylcytosine-specific restriction endonuclease McrA [Brevibacterium pityocampae]